MTAELIKLYANGFKFLVAFIYTHFTYVYCIQFCTGSDVSTVPVHVKETSGLLLGSAGMEMIDIVVLSFR